MARGVVQPLPLSDEYRVRIEYALGEAPKTWVESPILRSREEGGDIPHVYWDEGPRPCLYLPRSGEWRGERLLAATIVPWLLEWLVFYEDWHATGEWRGGGVHPPDRSGKAEEQ